MSLHALCEKGLSAGSPWLVFLHGFSGDNREWQTTGAEFSACPRLYIDLPGHGGSRDINVSSFTEVSLQLEQTLAHYHVQDYWLIGYSLGGRIAMFFASQPRRGLRGLVVEGSHPGLQDEQERRQRYCADAAWAERFRREPLAQVFTDWYQQPVFASLSAEQRDALVALRSHNSGARLAAMLEATSLAVQPDLRAQLRARHYPFHYLCGEYDARFRAIASDLDATTHIIQHAGHNAHRENPAAVVSCLAQFLAS
ncbi:2-succinyl-6-hydroxy-2,4-cyclohexadiene-1-carboxylate synthase [Klebsiella sp. I138]|uniref:2-succinyl-6-hydroxy-2, 4-cyclohexadiene-1-carboxylate synthase n=1 Tax=Klebsiella sp. I138 TaxID=2755385 RepID=UPI003DA7E6AD